MPGRRPEAVVLRGRHEEGAHLLPSSPGGERIADEVLEWTLGHARTSRPEPAGAQ